MSSKTRKKPELRTRRTKAEVEAILQCGIPPYLDATDVLAVTEVTPQRLKWLIEIGNFPEPDPAACSSKYRRWTTASIAGWFRKCRESVSSSETAGK